MTRDSCSGTHKHTVFLLHFASIRLQTMLDRSLSLDMILFPNKQMIMQAHLRCHSRLCRSRSLCPCLRGIQNRLQNDIRHSCWSSRCSSPTLTWSTSNSAPTLCARPTTRHAIMSRLCIRRGCFSGLSHRQRLRRRHWGCVCVCACISLCVAARHGSE